MYDYTRQEKKKKDSSKVVNIKPSKKCQNIKEGN